MSHTASVMRRQSRKTRVSPGRSRRRGGRPITQLEALEARTLLTVLDLTTLNASGTINGAIFSQYTPPQQGSVSLSSFLQLSTSASVEQGYNTNARPVRFNEATSSTLTHAIPLSAVPSLIEPGGVQYYEFVLTISQNTRSPGNLLSLDELRLYVTKTSTVQPANLSGYNATTHTLSDSGGHTYAPIYDMSAGGTSWVKLNGNLNDSDGDGDNDQDDPPGGMTLLIPASDLGTDPNQYVYLYSKFGVNNPNNGGPETWSLGNRTVEKTGSVSGRVYIDNTGSGVQQTGDPALAGTTVYLDANNNGSFDQGELTTVTGSNGTFSFSGLTAGTYHIRAISPAGYVATGSANSTVALTAGQQASGTSFGFFAYASLSGNKYQDLTGDSLTADDPLLNAQNAQYQPITFSLYNGSALVGTTTLDSQGHYGFTNLGPGTYTVVETVPSGWYQTAAPAAFTPTSGQQSTGNNFDDFLAVQITPSGSGGSSPVLTLKTTATPSSSLTVTQTSSTGYTVTLNNRFTGTFTTPSLQNLQVNPTPGAAIDTTGVNATPVVIYDVQGDNSYRTGSSGTTLYLNSGSSDSVSIAGGNNTLNLSNNTFGVTFDASMTNGTPQALDATGQHVLSVTGQFQTIVGSPYNDKITAAPASFNTTTGTAAGGTTILTGSGQDTIVGSLGTKAVINGSGTSYTQVLSSSALNSLSQAVQFGASAGVLSGFGASVTSGGGYANISAGILTNVSLAGNSNQFTQAIDANTASLINQAVAKYGASSTILGGFGNTITTLGNYNTVDASLLSTVNLSSGSNTFQQKLDSGAVSVLQSAVAQFGNSTTTLGGFGNALGALGSFRNTVITAGSSQISTSLLTNVTSQGSSNTIVQSIDSSAASVVDSTIQSMASQFGASSGVTGGFGGVLNALGAFADTINAVGDSTKISASLLSNVNLTGNNGTYVQGFDAGSASILSQALSSFGGTLRATGGFGAGVSIPGGFGSSLNLQGSYTTIVAGLLSSVSATGSNNQYAQLIDPTAASVLNQAIGLFGGSTHVAGGFGSGLNTLGGFGGSINLTGNYSTVASSLLSNVTLNGNNATYVEGLDPNSTAVLENAIAGFGASPGVTGGFGQSVLATGGFGNSLGSPGGFGNSVTINGNYSQVGASLLTTVNITGQTSTYVQQVDSNSAQVLSQAITSYGNAVASIGGFGNSTAPVGGFGAGLNTLGGFGNSVTLNGNYSQVGTSLLTNVSVSGDHALYVQSLDNNALTVLGGAISGFGASKGVPGGFGQSVLATGGFGNSLGSPGGFGNSLNLTGNYSEVVSSLITNATISGQNSIYLQRLDTNSAQLLSQAIGSFGTAVSAAGGFGSSAASIGGFGGALNNLGGFGNRVLINGGYSEIGTSILSTVTVSSAASPVTNQGHNLYIQALDSPSVNVLTAALAAFGATFGATGGFGASVGGGGGFGNSVSLDGSNNTINAGLLTTISASGGLNAFQQTIDTNAQTLLSTALQTIQGFGASPASLGGFSTSLTETGGYNNAQAGLLTRVTLSGGYDTFDQTLTQPEADFLKTALADAATVVPDARAATAAALGVQAQLTSLNDVFVGGLFATATAPAGGARFVIEDPTLLGTVTIDPSLLAYPTSVTNGLAPSTYYFVGTVLTPAIVNTPQSTGDTLDLSNLQGSGIHIDLNQTGSQLVLGTNLFLTLSQPTAFGTVIGNGAASSIRAGAAPVTILGAAPLDPRVNAPTLPPGTTQVVYLDFTTYANPNKIDYSDPTLQAAIAARMQSIFASFNVQIVLTPPPAGQPYATVFFDSTPVLNGQTESGGLSSEIDFRNLNLSDTSQVDITGLVGGAGEPPATRADIIAMSATIASHEIEHTMGMRHQDAFGPIGFGIWNPPGPAAFRPQYSGAAAAWETHEFVIASPASVGSSLFDAAGKAFIGEREAVKLAFDQGGTVVSETSAPHNTLSTAQPLTLAPLSVPNTLQNGFDAGKVFSVAAIDVINASLQDTSAGSLESDYYSFSGQAGDLMNLEVYSTSLTRITNSVDTELYVYGPSGTLVSQYGGSAFSDDDFESADPVLFDLKLPTTGTYTVEVREYNPAAAPGNYELFMYRFQAGNAIPTGGSADQFVMGPGNATFLGRGGNDTVVDSGATSYALANGSLTGTGTATLQNIAQANLTGAPGGTTFNMSNWTGSATFTGVGGTNTVVDAGASAYTLANGSLTGTGTATLQNIAQASLTGVPGGTSFDVSNWTGSATLTGVGGTNTVVLNLGSRAGDFTLTGNTLTVSSGGSFSLINIQNVILTANSQGSRFYVNGWTGGGSLNGGPGASVLNVNAATSLITLGNSQLAVNNGATLALQAIASANLTSTAAGTTFDVSNWTGSATLTGAAGASTATINLTSRTGNFTLTSNTLSVSTGGTFTLVNIPSVSLTASTSGSQFNINGWTGTGSLNGGPGASVLNVHAATSLITLGNSQLALNNGATLALQAIASASLTSTAAGTTFDVSNWTGSATLTGAGGASTATLNLASRTGNFALSSNTLSVSTGGTFTLVNIPGVLLTASTTGSQFNINGWTGTGSLIGGPGTDTLNVTAATDLVTLTTSQLTVHNGATLQLQSIDSANLTGTLGGTTFDVRGWTAPLTLGIAGDPNTVSNPHGIAVNAVEGSTAVVSTEAMTDLGSPVAANYTTSVAWGDNATSAGTVATSGSTITGQGSHAYEEGTYTVTTTIRQGLAFGVIVSSQATVSDAPLTITSKATSLPMGVSLTGQPLVTFTDANPSAPVKDYSATINWGDGSAATAGTVTQTGSIGTPFTVSGSHVYTTTGTFPVTVAVQDVGGSSVTATFSVLAAPSIFVLSPTLSGALTISGAASIKLAGAVIVDSNSPTALVATGSATITTANLQVVGGASLGSAVVVKPAPVTGAAAVADPLASLPVPSLSGAATAVNLSGGSLTINPGLYSSIKVSGTGALTMNPGVYVIKGGGFSISNSSSVTGTGVVIYNAGSNYPNSGGSFAGVSFSSTGTINLSAPQTGTYAGVAVFQSRDNTLADSVNGSSVVGLSGIFYAPKALLSVSGNAQMSGSAIVNQLQLSGSAGSTLTTSDVSGSSTTTAGQLLSGNLMVYVDPTTTSLSADQEARLQDALSGLTQLLSPYSIQVGQVSDPALATMVLQVVSTTAIGGQQAGVLGLYQANAAGGVIDLVSGWNWYTQADPLGIGATQYDFETILLHELGHALGLGHSGDPSSVMYATLSLGVDKRTMTTADLDIPSLDPGPDALMAAVVPATSLQFGSLATFATLPTAVATLPQSAVPVASQGLGTGSGTAPAIGLSTPTGPAGMFRIWGQSGSPVPLVSGARGLLIPMSPASPMPESSLPTPEGPLDEQLPDETTTAPAAEPGETSPTSSPDPGAPPLDLKGPAPAGEQPIFDGSVFPTEGIALEMAEPTPALAGLALVLGLPGASRFVKRLRDRETIPGAGRDEKAKSRRFRG